MAHPNPEPFVASVSSCESSNGSGLERGASPRQAERSPAWNGRLLRRGNTRWGAAGSEPPVRSSEEAEERPAFGLSQADSQRWPNRWFAGRGLFSLEHGSGLSIEVAIFVWNRDERRGVDTVFLYGCSFLAGFVDAIVGGGGLIQLPALFLFSPLDASRSLGTIFGTNKLASICGTSVAAYQYAKRVKVPWGSVFPAALAAFIFSFLGARLVSSLPAELLKPLVLCLLIAVALYTYLRKDLGDLHLPRFQPTTEKMLGVVVGGAIGFYDGFFGPGTGSFLIFSFVGLFGFDFLTASASAKVVNVATNLSALIYFIATDQVAYAFALPMGACNVLGSIAGARMAILKGNRFVRGFFLLIIAAMILKFGYEVVKSTGSG